MRRKEREVVKKESLIEILEKCDVCRLGFAVDGLAYVVPLNFGYQWKEKLVLYFHGGKEGRKIDLMRKNNRVCFEMDTGRKLEKSPKACGWGMYYKSIIGMGKLIEVEGGDERQAGLNCIMRHYGGPDKNEFDPKIFDKTVVLKLEAEEVSGKAKL
jgi:hypothetical protein